MRTTVTLDDELVKRATAVTGIRERSRLIQNGLRALIEREAAARFARLGGSMPELEDVPRRRPSGDDAR